MKTTNSMITKDTSSGAVKRLVVFGLWNCIKGYVYGIWLKLWGGLRRQKLVRSVEMVAYNVFQNPHVLVLDSIYPEIGVGIYQGEIVIIREAVTPQEHLRRWVIYKPESRLSCKLAQELLNSACIVAQNILTGRDYESCLKD